MKIKWERDGREDWKADVNGKLLSLVKYRSQRGVYCSVVYDSHLMFETRTLGQAKHICAAIDWSKL